MDAIALLKGDHAKVKKMLTMFKHARNVFDRSTLEELGQQMKARKDAGLAA